MRLCDINELEAIQRRATRLIPSVSDLPYEQRLRQLKLHSLAYRRLRGGMIYVYKYLKSLLKTTQNLFTLSDSSTRGHPQNLAKPRVNTSLRQSYRGTNFKLFQRKA